jgi:hypothetical protein
LYWWNDSGQDPPWRMDRAPRFFIAIAEGYGF